MYDRATTLEIIDRAFDEQPFCATCGAPSVLLNEGDRVILECSAPDSTALLARIGDFLMPHTRRVVLDLAAELAA